jgi:uncharacterized protein YbjT (DUF2867 family)
MKEKILVTGATGVIGKELVKQLLGQGFCVRIAVRSPEKAADIDTCGCPLVVFDYTKHETFQRAFEGIDGLFLATPIMSPKLDELIMPAINAAKEMGVSHIVSLGAVGMSQGHDSPMSIAEKCVQGCGLKFTILRPNLLMQNFQTLAGMLIRNTGLIHLPAGDAKISFVDARDIAAAAAQSLLKKEHQNKIYMLTGKEALDHYKIAEILSRVTSKKIVYIPVSHNEAEQELLRVGWDDDAAELMIGLYEIARHGWCEEISADLEMIIGREPIPFEKFAQDYKETWI